MIATGNPATVTIMIALNVQSGSRNRPPIISNASMTPKPTTAYMVTSRVTPRRLRSAMNRDSLEGLPDIACLDWYIAIYNLSNYKSNEIIPKNLRGLNGCNAIKLYPDLKMHRDRSVTLIFNYHDGNGELITEFSVGPERYR